MAQIVLVKTYTYTDRLAQKVVFKVTLRVDSTLAEADEAFTKATGEDPSKQFRIGVSWDITKLIIPGK